MIRIILFFVGYAEENIGYKIFVPDLKDVITTVHMVFNTVFFHSSEEYIKDLERLFVIVDEKARTLDDFKFWTMKMVRYTKLQSCQSSRIHCGISSLSNSARGLDT